MRSQKPPRSEFRPVTRSITAIPVGSVFRKLPGIDRNEYISAGPPGSTVSGRLPGSPSFLGIGKNACADSVGYVAADLIGPRRVVGLRSGYSTRMAPAGGTDREGGFRGTAGLTRLESPIVCAADGFPARPCGWTDDVVCATDTLTFPCRLQRTFAAFAPTRGLLASRRSSHN